jgi:flagellar FliL protein
MAEAEEEEKKEGEGEAAPKKSKKKLIIIIVAVLVLLGGGVGGFLVLGKKPPAEDAEAAQEQEEHEHLEVVELDNFIVNLSENSSFLKVRINLEVSSNALHASAAADAAGGGHGAEDKGGLPGALGAREPMIRDSIIRILSSKRAEEVLSPEGKDTLKEELVDAVNEAVGAEEPIVQGVYFADFIIQ